MPDPGLTRPDLCSIPAADAEAEPAGAARGGLSADGHPPAGDDPPAPLATGIDRAIRLSTAAAVLAVAGIAAYVSYWHAYAVVRAHGETGITARLEPATIDGLVYASSMVVLYAAAAPGAGPLPRPLAARAGHRRDPHGEHGTGLVPRSRRGGDRGLAGGQSRGLVRTPGLAHPHLRGGTPRAVGSAPRHWCGLPCCRGVLSRPQPLTATAPEANQRDTSGPAWRPAGQAAGPLSVPADGERDDEALEASAGNDAAVAAYRLSVQAGNPLSERRLAQMFGRTSRRWARARIADARQASPLPDSPSTPVAAYPQAGTVRRLSGMRL